jgi:hypothetical protein
VHIEMANGKNGRPPTSGTRVGEPLSWNFAGCFKFIERSGRRNSQVLFVHTPVLTVFSWPIAEALCHWQT